MVDSKSTIVTVTGIYSLVRALLGICGSLALLGLGSVVGVLGGSNVLQEAQQAGADLSAQELAALQAAVGGGGILVSLLGIVTLLVSIALLVDAVGLFQSKPWAWMLTIVLYGASALLAVLGFLNGGITILNVVFLAIDLVIVYLFWTSEEVKRALGK